MVELKVINIIEQNYYDKNRQLKNLFPFWHVHAVWTERLYQSI